MTPSPKSLDARLIQRWLPIAAIGMAMHRKNPRRVLSALRMLLTSPKPRPIALLR